MFDVSNVFRVSLFALISYAACMLALAEGAVFPGVLTIPLAVLAYFLTERRRTLRLSALWANLLGLLALLLSAGEWLSSEMTTESGSVMLGRLLAGTHLLVYLAWIVLFQEKAPRHYWGIMALSLLQVAVGAVLTDEGVYGLLLFAYLFAAVWTLSLFSLHQARRREEPETSDEAGAAAKPAVAEAMESGFTEPGRSRPFGNASSNQIAPSLGEVIVQPSRVLPEESTRSPSEYRLDARFVAGTLATALASVGVALVFFLLVPRVWIGRLPIVSGDASSALRARFTGFSDEVQLGAMGQILESTERVLFVRMYDSDGEEIDVPQYALRMGYDEPLFRGAVLGTYENGRWDDGAMGQERSTAITGSRRSSLVRQEYRLKPLGSGYLFAMHPVFGCELSAAGSRRVRYKRFSSMLLRPESVRRDAMVKYVTYSPQRPDTSNPLGSPLSPRSSRSFQRTRERWAQCTRFPNEDQRLSRLEALAKRVSGYDAGDGSRPSDREMADRLVAHLRDSGEYLYSLDSSLVDAEDDPVEDFLFNRKQGHCEYFASALALMLRAVGIPSRLVSGFKGGETNTLNGEFYVEQRHAHAWVEGYIDGRWVTLDPTPAARSASVAGLAPALLSLGDLFNLFKDNWQDYFISMDRRTQQEQFYDPLWRAVRSSRSSRTEAAGSLRELLTSPRTWFSWQGGVATAVLLLSLSGLVWMIQRLRRTRSRDGRRDGTRRTARQIRVDFYERFRAICAARGLARGEAQTEREFTPLVLQSMDRALAAAGLRRLPGNLVETFYGVRFGGESLGPEAERQIDSRLTELERALASNPTNGKNGEKGTA